MPETFSTDNKDHAALVSAALSAHQSKAPLPKAPALPRVNALTGSYQLPPVTTQIKNASGALIRATGALLSGERVKAPEEVIEERRAICGACEFLQGNRCVKCGCWYKTKITLSTEACPEKKWSVYAMGK
jgi:hypothetical protein